MPRPKRAAARKPGQTVVAAAAARRSGTVAKKPDSKGRRSKAATASSAGETCVDGAGTIWTPEKTLSEIRRVYEANREPIYADIIKKYMRNQYEFYGLKAPLRRQLDLGVRRTVGLVSGDDCRWSPEQLHALVRLLWKQTEREFQHFALEVARALVDQTLYDFDRAVALLRYMIMNKSWWDTVDMIAPHLVGALVSRKPARGAILMDKWIKDEHLWIRRAAILHQLSYKKNCKEEVLFRYSLTCGHETDFFIQKAIGWALRSHAFVNPAAVKGFILSNEEKLSKLSKKEGLKHLGGWPCKTK